MREQMTEGYNRPLPPSVSDASRADTSPLRREEKVALPFSRLQFEAFVDPASNAAGHDLDRPVELGQPQRAPRRAVAVRASAIGDEQGILRPLRHLGRDDLAVRQVDRPLDVALGIERRATDIEQDKVGALGQRVMNVPAVGLIGELGGEVLTGKIAWRGRNGADGGFHGSSCYRVGFPTLHQEGFGVIDIVRKNFAKRCDAPPTAKTPMMTTASLES